MALMPALREARLDRWRSRLARWRRAAASRQAMTRHCSPTAIFIVIFNGRATGFVDGLRASAVAGAVMVSISAAADDARAAIFDDGDFRICRHMLVLISVWLRRRGHFHLGEGRPVASARRVAEGQQHDNQRRQYWPP